MGKKLKIYLDTSIINFLFADDAPEKKEVTIDFFENYLKDYDVFISKIVIDEINKTSSFEKKEKLLNSIKDYYLEIFDQTNLDIENAADTYIQNEIIPPNKREDALHLAFASYYEFDILLSWNFKHLANIKIQEKVNFINIQLGFRKYLLLFNPMEVIYDK
jgi:predicted nucleic acid-binding protein